MREHDDLGARLPTFKNLVNRMIAAEAVHAGERIIKDDNLVRAVCVLLKLCQEKRQRERAPVSTAQRVFEAWPVCGRCSVTQFNRILVNQNLVTRARRPPR